MKAFFLYVAVSLMTASCQKFTEGLIPASAPEDQYTRYIIPSGRQFCQGNTYKPIETGEMKFLVRFDSSAIYQTADPANQYDINKLYGFSDNNADHHQYSARFGWRWTEGALRLFAYVYNTGEVFSKELATVSINQEISCSIQITDTRYLFQVNDIVDSMPRLSKTIKAKGYQLYPYFGGDEAAPHEINIWIRNVK